MYKYIFAGKTAIKSSIIPQEANFLLCLNNNKIPSKISINPLTITAFTFHFIIGGTIVIKNLDL